MATQTIVAGDTSFDAVGAGDSFFVLYGSQGIVGNVDGSGQNTSVLAEIASGFTGSIGTASDPWKTAFSTRLVNMAGSGNIYFESNAADTETTALIYQLGGGTLHLQGSAAVITRMEMMRGTVNAGNGVTLTTARCAGGSLNIADTGTGAAVTTLDVIGGSVYSQRPVTTTVITSGNLTIDSDGAGATNAQTTVSLYGGTLNLLDCGTITTLNIFGGQLILSQNRPLTVTNTNICMHLPWAQAFLDSTNIVTFTNAPTRIISDGRPV